MTEPINDVTILQRVKSVLLDARRELIDLSRRNRLLHTPRIGKRPHCLEIIDADPDTLFVIRRTSKQFGFSPINEGELNGTGPKKPNGTEVQRLQTNLAPEPLDRRLLKLFREARTFEEEQGVNILFLAIGFLNWFEDARSEERCSAPLLLVPVSLERRQGRDFFVMRGRDDDMIVNVSLGEKLRATFGITLPDLPEGDEWLPSQYFDAVAAVTSGEKRWEVDRKGIGLGFFTFSRFLMWRDLDAATWPDGGKLLGNSLLAKLLGEGPAGQPEPQIFSDDESIDRHIDLAAAIHVLDADSSQAVCVDEVRRGRDLVIQGPPGTGKSQTIANIIATAAYEGKSVLFVAEKAAALDVVHSRLKTVGLDPLCLEIHSKKATKLSVVGALEKSIRAEGVTQLDSRNSQELRVARDQLNGWSATLHREIHSSGRTPFQVMGKVLKLHTDGVRVLGQRLDAAANWDRDRIRAAEQAVERAASAVQKIEVIPIKHCWHGTLATRLTPFDVERLKTELSEGCRLANDAIALGSKSATFLRANSSLRCADAESFARALRQLARLPQDGREALSHPAWRTERARIAQLVEGGKAWSSNCAEIVGCVEESSWPVNIGSVRYVIAARGKSVFRTFSRRYREAVTDLESLCRGKPPRKRKERLALLAKLIMAQSARRKLHEEQDFASAALGSVWASEKTRWAAVESLLAWVEEADKCGAPVDLLAVAMAGDDQFCTSLANSLEKSVGLLRSALIRISEIVRPSPTEIFGIEDIEQVPLHAMLERLDAWVKAVNEFNDWVNARDALDNLVSMKMEMIAEGLKDGSIEPSEGFPITELLIAEALWGRARIDDPSLDQIDGAHRSEVVSQFRALDRRRIQLARSEVLARYLERRPNGEAGEMGVVRAEIGKKRRHLTIRKLMEQAGSAVQKLKPVFLMSPLSVAQFLPLGRMNFDLVVIDEASQVPPEEALGVLARGRQMVIVGDDKQLPPTNFFRMVSADDDDEEAEETTAPGKTRDFESVLKLACARGATEQMLRWHYRSRHPSLIALSNKECYGGRLLLPPSPRSTTDDLGLSFVASPRGHYDRGGSGRNPAEADMIAAAVENHITKWPDRSLGLACFSVAQRDAIEDSLQRCGVLAAAEAFAPKGERLFIKNLESVQGDERDVIFISIGYGPDAQGRMTVGFGPLSSDGGERRLNVLISRARLQCSVFSSITAGDIPADTKPRGTRMLREFLYYAETKHIAAGQVNGADYDSPFEEAVAVTIRRGGYEVTSQVGVTGFRIDLGVAEPISPGRFILGVECDGATYHSGRSARDRDRLRQEVLEGLGWKLYRIWSTDWFRNPQREAERLLSAVKQASHENGAGVESPRLAPNANSTDSTNFVLVPHTENGRVAHKPILPTQLSKEDAPGTYTEVRLEVPLGVELFDLSRKELGELTAKVVQHEGPIHVEEVARRVREAFGLGRTGRRILESISEALEQAERQGKIARDGEFWSVTNSSLKNPRCRRGVAASLRRPDRIAPVEYRLAIVAVLQATVAASSSELTVGAARILGFDRTGPDLDQAISDQIDFMIQNCQVQAADGKIHLS